MMLFYALRHHSNAVVRNIFTILISNKCIRNVAFASHTQHVWENAFYCRFPTSNMLLFGVVRFVSVQCGAVLHSRHTSYHPSCSVSLCNSVRLHVLVFVNVAVFVVVYSINEYFEIAFLQRSRATQLFFILRVSKNWSKNTLVYRGDSPLAFVELACHNKEKGNNKRQTPRIRPNTELKRWRPFWAM